jgi:tetratricopeptide (TPR) repeat protein
MTRSVGTGGVDASRHDFVLGSGAGHSSLARWLLRPFIDLEPCEHGPLCARGVEHYWLALADAHRPRFVLQRMLPRPFRNLLLSEVGLPEYRVNDPRDLAPGLRSFRWSFLCERLDLWPELGTDQQCRLALILHALCFYSLILNRVPEIREVEISADPDRVELAYRRACARYVLGLPDRVADYDNADLTDLESIAKTAGPGHLVALNAAMMVLVHRAKVGAPAEDLDEWRARAERNLEAALVNRDDFTSALLLSRFHRAAAFVPQRQGEHAEVRRMMDLAERYARAMIPTDETQNLLRLENLYPVIESRTKEALWVGDLDLALVRAESLIDLDPYDSRAWLELGEVRLKRKEYVNAAEAYAVAATLGAPSSAVGCHMAGLCFRHVGQPLLAAFFFRASIQADSLASSPHDEIQRLPKLPVLLALKEWSLRYSMR